MDVQTSKKAIFGILSSGVLAACGPDSSLEELAALHEQTLTFDGRTTNAQIKVVEGEFDTHDMSPECASLRAKIFTARQNLKLTCEWRAVADTQAYSVLETHKAHFVGAGCNKAPTVPPKCAELSAKINADGEILANTAQWATLAATSRFADLFDRWNRATQIHCFD